MAVEDVTTNAAMPPEDSHGEDKKISAKHLALLVVVGLTSVTQGTVTKGWTAVLPKMQNDSSSFVNTEDDVAWLVSMTSVVGIFASLATGPLVELGGPQRVLTINVGLTVVLWLLLAFPPHKVVLYITRAGLAACAYFISTILQPLLAELSPNKFRGSASTFAEVGGSAGVLYGYLMAFLFPWKLATALCTLTSAILLIPLWFVPESPYWLVRRGRPEAAKASLKRLLRSEKEVNEELAAITSTPTATQTSRMQQFAELRKRQNIRPVVLVLCFFVLRELGGRSCILMYTVYIFREAGVDLDAFTCTVLVGAARFLCTCVTAAILDHIGRRPLLMTTSVMAAVSLGVCGLFLYSQVPGASWVPLVAILIYVTAYGIGIGPIPWVYVGELVPSPVRSIGASIIAACDALVVFSINLAFLKIIYHFGLGMTFLAFGVVNLFIAIIVYLWIPESRGVSLQELEGIFAAENRSQMAGEKTL